MLHENAKSFSFTIAELNSRHTFAARGIPAASKSRHASHSLRTADLNDTFSEIPLVMTWYG